MDINFNCSCGQPIVIDATAAGLVVQCPSCGQDVIVPKPPPIREPQSASLPVTLQRPEVKTDVKQGAVIGGWACFVIAAILLIFPLPTFFFWIPFVIAAFVLSIVAMAQKRILGGLLLLLAVVIGVPILWCQGMNNMASLPSLKTSRERGRRAVSASNLKQVGLALQIFADAHGGKLPQTLDDLDASFIQNGRVLIDPESGHKFAYIGAGRSWQDSSSDSVVAYSPTDLNGRNVLYNNGSVEWRSSAEFEQATNRWGR